MDRKLNEKEMLYYFCDCKFKFKWLKIVLMKMTMTMMILTPKIMKKFIDEAEECTEFF